MIIIIEVVKVFREDILKNNVNSIVLSLFSVV